MQGADVVALGEGVEDQLPVDVPGVLPRLGQDVAFEAIVLQLVLGASQRALGGEPLAGLGLGEDEAVAFGDEDRQEAAVRLGRVVERGLGVGPGEQGAVEAVDPAMIGAGEARALARAGGDRGAAVAAGVDEAAQRAVRLADDSAGTPPRSAVTKEPGSAQSLERPIICGRRRKRTRRSSSNRAGSA